MTERPLDAERVAALLDGKLNAEEREQILAQLAADPDWREIALEAGVVAADLQQSQLEDVPRLTVEGAPASMPQGEAKLEISRGNGKALRRTLPWVALAAAASLTVFVLGKPDAVVRVGATVTSPASARQIAVGGDALSDLTRDRWATVRSGSVALDRITVSVRLGALAVDSHLDREGGGAEARAEMIDLMQALPVAGAAIGLLRQATDSATQVTAAAAVRAVADTSAFDAGVWLELVRAGSESAMADRSQIALLTRVAASRSLTPEAAHSTAAAIAQLERDIIARRPLAAQTAASDVLRLLAS